MMNTIHLNQKFVYLLYILFFCKPYYHCAYTLFFITKILILEYKEKCHHPQKSIFSPISRHISLCGTIIEESTKKDIFH